MSGGANDLGDHHSHVAELIAREIEEMLPDGMAFVLLVANRPTPGAGTEELGGGMASNSSLLAPLMLANTLAIMCQPVALVELVESCRIEGDGEAAGEA